MGLKNFNLINAILFPTPERTYDLHDFPDELIWIPKSLDPTQAPPEDCVPCLLLSSPSARFFIIYLHSNAEDLGRCYTFCSMLRHQFQVNVLAVEYPGYGICPGGQAHEETVIENATVGFKFLRQVMNWPLDSIMVFGRSIGCGPALAIAMEYKVYGVILVCPFLSVREVCKNFIGPFAEFVEERFPNKDRVKHVRSPLLVVHGKLDSVVPWTHGQALYNSCPSRKRLVTPAGMHHNTNLHSDATFFVLPMLQFFALPDYNFDELQVPQWAYDKRLSIRFAAVGAPAGPLRTDHKDASGAPATGPKAPRSTSPRPVQPTGDSADGSLSPARSDSRQRGRANSCPASRATGAADNGTAQSTPVASDPSSVSSAPSGSEPRTDGPEPFRECHRSRDPARSATASASMLKVQKFLEGSDIDSLQLAGAGDATAPKGRPLRVERRPYRQRLLPQAKAFAAAAWQGGNDDDMEDEAQAEEELPLPPEDAGFFKVPRTRAGGACLVPETLRDSAGSTAFPGIELVNGRVWWMDFGRSRGRSSSSSGARSMPATPRGVSGSGAEASTVPPVGTQGWRDTATKPATSSEGKEAQAAPDGPSPGQERVSPPVPPLDKTVRI